jgi:hypothetical protein
MADEEIRAPAQANESREVLSEGEALKQYGEWMAKHSPQLGAGHATAGPAPKPKKESSVEPQRFD